MKVQVKLKVTAEEFFENIVTSVLYEAEQARGKKVPEKKLKVGFTYQKQLNAKMGGAQSVTTKITEFEPPFLYAASIISVNGENIIRYEIEPVDGDNAITLVYEESYVGEKLFNDLNGKMMGALYTPFAKRKIKKRFHEMELYIIKQRAASASDEPAQALEEEVNDVAVATEGEK